jgi:hypothetical protein
MISPAPIEEPLRIEWKEDIEPASLVDSSSIEVSRMIATAFWICR